MNIKNEHFRGNMFKILRELEITKINNEKFVSKCMHFT